MKNMSLIKKFTLFALCALTFIPALLFTGCGNKGPNYEKQGFTAVHSVTYQIFNGNHVTVYSNYRLEFDEQEITEEEYNRLDCEIKPFVIDGIISSDKTVNYKIGEMFKYTTYGTTFFKATIKDIKYLYLYVKIINENQIEIFNSKQNEHLLINTDYFEIEYFA